MPRNVMGSSQEAGFGGENVGLHPGDGVTAVAVVARRARLARLAMYAEERFMILSLLELCSFLRINSIRVYSPHLARSVTSKQYELPSSLSSKTILPFVSGKYLPRYGSHL